MRKEPTQAGTKEGAALAEAEPEAVIPEDDVVDEPHTDQLARIGHPTGEGEILGAEGGIA